MYLMAFGKEDDDNHVFGKIHECSLLKDMAQLNNDREKARFVWWNLERSRDTIYSFGDKEYHETLQTETNMKDCCEVPAPSTSSFPDSPREVERPVGNERHGRWREQRGSFSEKYVFDQTCSLHRLGAGEISQWTDGGGL